MATYSNVLAGESQGWGSLMGYCLWGHTESDKTEATQQQQQHSIALHKPAVQVTKLLKFQFPYL